MKNFKSYDKPGDLKDGESSQKLDFFLIGHIQNVQFDVLEKRNVIVLKACLLSLCTDLLKSVEKQTKLHLCNHLTENVYSATSTRTFILLPPH